MSSDDISALSQDLSGLNLGEKKGIKEKLPNLTADIEKIQNIIPGCKVGIAMQNFIKRVDPQDYKQYLGTYLYETQLDGLVYALDELAKSHEVVGESIKQIKSILIDCDDGTLKKAGEFSKTTYNNGNVIYITRADRLGSGFDDSTNFRTTVGNALPYKSENKDYSEFDFTGFGASEVASVLGYLEEYRGYQAKCKEQGFDLKVDMQSFAKSTQPENKQFIGSYIFSTYCYAHTNELVSFCEDNDSKEALTEACKTIMMVGEKAADFKKIEKDILETRYELKDKVLRCIHNAERLGSGPNAGTMKTFLEKSL